MGQSPADAVTIQRATPLLAKLYPAEIILVQMPVLAGGEDADHSLPEPDLAVLRERKPEHAKRHPRGDELLLVIEVSDSAAAFDQSRKSALYAAAGVPEYWVLDLTRRMLVAHGDSDGVQYRHIRPYPGDESIAFPGRPESVRVADILPPA
jgi:Uma2 family endonuclease